MNTTVLRVIPCTNRWNLFLIESILIWAKFKWSSLFCQKEANLSREWEKLLAKILFVARWYVVFNNIHLFFLLTYFLHILFPNNQTLQKDETRKVLVNVCLSVSDHFQKLCNFFWREGVKLTPSPPPLFLILGGTNPISI